MTFAHEGYLLYLWLIPILLWVFWANERLLARRLTRFANLDNLNRLYRRPRYRLVGYCCLVSAFVVLVIALAQPRLGYSWLEQQQRGKDLYVVLDVSKSMLATDIKPSRLQRAKRKLHDLLTMLDGDRISLIAFAGASFVHCPLTNDYGAAQLFLDHLSPELIPVQGTAIGDALRLALKSINETSTAEGAAIILLTDGEDQGTEPLKVAEQAKQRQVKIFAIGIGGNEAIPITTSDGDLIKDRQGKLVLSKLDETTLQQLAITTGGSYVRSVSGDFDLQQIYDKGIREKISDQEFAENSGKRRVWHEHFYLFILIALLLLVIEVIAKGYRQPLIGFLLFIALNRPIVARDGHEAFADKDYQQAARQFLKEEIDNPDDLELTYNRAVSQYFNKNYQGAASGFAKATKDPKLALKSWFNLGNSQVALNRLEDAKHSYQQALKIDPNNHKAKENLEWVNQQLKQQQEQKNQQDQQQQDQQKQDQQQQDQQQQDQQQQDQQQQDQQKQDQQQKQNDQKNHQKSAGEQRALSEEEIAKLLRQLDDKIGVRPRKLTPAESNNVQDW